MKKVSILLWIVGLALLSTNTSKAQQWFVKNFDFSSAINQKPDFKAGGTYITKDANEQATGVLIFGTIGYSANELSGGDGGFGNSDGVILFNDVSGNNQWGITIGTAEDDIISRVVEDSDGNLAVTGVTKANGSQEIFLLKIKTSSFPFSVEWSYTFGSGMAQDMINANAYGSLLDSEGYAVCGKTSGGKSFAMLMGLNGTLKWSHEFTASAAVSPSLDFRSLIQPKIKDLTLSALPFYDNYLVIGGVNSGSGYLMRLDLNTGAFVNDIKTKSLTSNCVDDKLPFGFASIDQWQNGDIVAFGNYTAQDLVLMAFSNDASGFTPKWNSIHNSGGAVIYAYDINATASGYLGVVETNGDRMELFEYNRDGDILDRRGIENNTSSNVNWSFRRHPYVGGNPPYVDFDMECGNALHLTGTQGSSPNPPASWSVDNVAHARFRLNTVSCMEHIYSLGNDEFCDDFTIEVIGPDAGITGFLIPVITDFGINSVEISPSSICASTCPQSACVDPEIYYAANGQDYVLLEAEPGYSFYEWSNGFTNNSISVSTVTDVNAFSVDQTDANGCVTTKLFFIARKLKRGAAADPNEVSIEEISLYPNPTSGDLSIDIPKDGISVQIFDSMGKLVRSAENLNSGTHRLDISELANGLFSVRFSGTGINKTIKITKN